MHEGEYLNDRRALFFTFEMCGNARVVQDTAAFEKVFEQIRNLQDLQDLITQVS